MAFLFKPIYFVIVLAHILYFRVLVPVGVPVAVVAVLYLLWKRSSPFAQQR